MATRVVLWFAIWAGHGIVWPLLTIPLGLCLSTFLMLVVCLNWPSYHAATPQQRSRYLDWLVGERCDPNIEIGYVFIYFYGLERRILVDDADHEAVAQEVLRLRSIYSRSRSFQRYSTSLLWLILALTGQRRIVHEGLVAKIIESTERWRWARR